MTQETFKHLDYIQSTINRMAGNQFQIKGWSITIDTAILTIFANSFNRTEGPNIYFLLIAAFPILLFWMLDAKFLSTERRLRRIYMDVADGVEGIRPFEMPISKYAGQGTSVWNCAISFGNICVYLLPLFGFLAGFDCFAVIG